MVRSRFRRPATVPWRNLRSPYVPYDPISTVANNVRNVVTAAGAIRGSPMARYPGWVARDVATRISGRKRPNRFGRSNPLVRAAQSLGKRARSIRSRGSQTAPVRRRRQYVVRGRYIGAFKRGKRIKFGRVATSGVMIRTEKGGIVEQDKCVYIGHSTCAQVKLVKIVVWAIIRRLAAKMGQNLTSMKEHIQSEMTTGTVGFSPGELIYYYSAPGENNEKLKRTIAVGADTTWETLADAVVTDMNTVFTSSHLYHMLHDFVFRPKTEDASAQPLMPLQKCM